MHAHVIQRTLLGAAAAVLASALLAACGAAAAPAASTGTDARLIARSGGAVP